MSTPVASPTQQRIVYPESLRVDQVDPTFLHGYGGFNIPVTPQFSLPQIVWMERGGIYAVANLRGGGEYGEEWHQAGSRLKKQNVFDDFIAAAEWLVANRYTSRRKLSIGGNSNGGLLTAASMVQRPDLFGAVIVGVGVLDMLRFHKFTIGWGWTSDYGSPDDPQEFKATLIRIDTRAGHGGGKPVSKQIQEAADELSFLFHELREDPSGGTQKASGR